MLGYQIIWYTQKLKTALTTFVTTPKDQRQSEPTQGSIMKPSANQSVSKALPKEGNSNSLKIKRFGIIEPLAFFFELSNIDDNLLNLFNKINKYNNKWYC